MSLDTNAPAVHFRACHGVTNRGFPGLECLNPGTNCTEPLPSEDVLTLPRKFLRRICTAIGLIALMHLSADRKSTRLNSSHLVISYAVFCLKKKKKQKQQ